LFLRWADEYRFVSEILGGLRLGDWFRIQDSPLFAGGFEFFDAQESCALGKLAPGFKLCKTVYDPGGFVLCLHLLPLRLANSGHFGLIKRGDKALDLLITVPLIFRFELMLRAALILVALLLFLACLASGTRFEAFRNRSILFDKMDVETSRVRILGGPLAMC